ncbi:MAG TPA: peptidase S8, partial [Candidatus Limnocylindria bacterium]
RPDPGEVDPGGAPPGPAAPPDVAAPSEQERPSDVPVLVALVLAMAGFLALAVAVVRRAERRQP